MPGACKANGTCSRKSTTKSCSIGAKKKTSKTNSTMKKKSAPKSRPKVNKSDSAMHTMSSCYNCDSYSDSDSDTFSSSCDSYDSYDSYDTYDSYDSDSYSDSSSCGKGCCNKPIFSIALKATNQSNRKSVATQTESKPKRKLTSTPANKNRVSTATKMFTVAKPRSQKTTGAATATKATSTKKPKAVKKKSNSTGRTVKKEVKSKPKKKGTKTGFTSRPTCASGSCYS